jgi:hypothetical protein
VKIIVLVIINRGGRKMKASGKSLPWVLGAFLIAVIQTGCAPVQEQAREQKQATMQEAARVEAKKPAKPPVEIEGVISGVGQRTITFQYERKGKRREEVVGVDAKTDIEKAGQKVRLRDLQETDKALIKYEPEAYTPAHSIKVIGKGEVKKAGGGD